MSLFKQSFDVLIKLSSKGKSKGILKTAIKPELLFVFEAIAATNVSVDAIAELPKIIHNTNDK